MSNRLPTLKYTWQIDINNVAGTSISTLDSYQTSLYQLKEVLTGFALFPWTVAFSSDSITASAGDNWAASTDVVADVPGNAHSWIVLQHPTRDTQYLIDFNNVATAGRIVGLFADFEGNYTGGTITNRPTSTTEMIIDDSAQWLGPVASAFNSWVHVWHQNNGDRTRVYISTSASQGGGGFWLFDAIDSPSDLWTFKEALASCHQITSGGSPFSVAAIMDVPHSISTVTRFFKGKISSTNHSNKAIIFDGANDHIVIGDVIELDFSHTDTFSISVWFKTAAATATERVIMSKKDTATTLTGWSIGVEDGEVFVYLTNDSGGGNEIEVRSTTTTFNDNLWHHLVVSYDGSELASGVSIYVDNSLETNNVITDGLSATISNSISATIAGANGSSGIEWQDLLDDIAIYDIELSAANVTTIYNGGIPNDLTVAGPTGNLIGYWLMGDSDVYPTISDESASGNDGTMTTMTIDDIVSDTPGIMTLEWGAQVAEIGTGTTAMVTDRAAAAVQNELDDLTGSSAYPFIPIFIASGDKNYKGFHGFIDDLWWGTSVYLPDPGNTYPDDSNNRQFAQTGQVIFPWTNDSTAPLLGESTPPNNTSDGHFTGISDIVGSSQTDYFQMEGIDSGNPSQPAYHNWVVTVTPDSSGAQATGPDAPPFGGPLTNIVVSNQWTQ